MKQFDSKAIKKQQLCKFAKEKKKVLLTLNGRYKLNQAGLIRMSSTREFYMGHINR